MPTGEETTGWRPMEQAPKDGTRIIVTVRASEQGPAAVDTAYWSQASRMLEAGWRAADSHGEYVVAYQEAELLGWMALPEPGSAFDPPSPMRESDVEESGGSGI